VRVCSSVRACACLRVCGRVCVGVCVVVRCFVSTSAGTHGCVEPLLSPARGSCAALVSLVQTRCAGHDNWAVALEFTERHMGAEACTPSPEHNADVRATYIRSVTTFVAFTPKCVDARAPGSCWASSWRL
jgi:hypothetical protein